MRARTLGPIRMCLALLVWTIGMNGCRNDAPPTPPASAPVQLPVSSVQPLAAPVSDIHFRDASEDWGMNFQRDDDIGTLHRILESNGGGVGVIDYDRDGWPDLLLTNGCPLPLSRAAVRVPDALYRNVAGKRVVSTGKQAGIAAVGYHHGCTVGDWNSDGFPDLYIAALGKNVFYVNQGDGTFIEMAAELGVEVPVWSSSPVFADLDGDGFLDLYVTNYVQTGDDPPHLCPEPNAPDGYITCPPTVYEGEPDACFRSDGAGAFVNVTKAWNLGGDAPKGLGCVVADLDQNGIPDIFVTNDGVPNFCFMRASYDKPFADEALIRGVALDASGRAMGNMGIGIGDADGNGWLDLHVTTFYSEPNIYYRATEQGNYQEEIKRTKMAAPTQQMLGFGTLFFDPNNDGWPDLFIANGHIDDMRWRVASLPYQMPPQLFRNTRKGIFDEVTASAGDYFQKKWLGRGVASVDLNQDGRVDLVVSHQLDRSSIVMNESPAPGHSLSVRCIGTTANRSAISTKLWLETDERTHYHEIVGGSSYNSAPDLCVHFGVGLTQPKSLRVQWLDGQVETFPQPQPGQYTLVQGQGLFLNAMPSSAKERGKETE